jgi:hypothetical protein
MYNRVFTPDRITELKPNEIFVFGSNLAGIHGGGAARLAYTRFGAKWEQGVGLQGQSYAIPTMQGGVETIKPYVDQFIEFAKNHPEYKFLVTRIGCGIAAFTSADIAPLFLNAYDVENVILPKDFVEILSKMQEESRKPTDEEQQALKMWTMGAGDSAKRFNGENPIPEKTKVATKDSWQTEPMPDEHTTIAMNVRIPSAAMRVVKCGHIPEAMEDHWFMYCDETTIRYYRSWSGICIYVAKYHDDGETCSITELTVNRDREQYGCTDNDHDVALFMALLTDEYGGDASEYWKAALK